MKSKQGHHADVSKPARGGRKTNLLAHDKVSLAGGPALTVTDTLHRSDGEHRNAGIQQVIALLTTGLGGDNNGIPLTHAYRYGGFGSCSLAR